MRCFAGKLRCFDGYGLCQAALASPHLTDGARRWVSPGSVLSEAARVRPSARRPPLRAVLQLSDPEPNRKRFPQSEHSGRRHLPSASSGALRMRTARVSRVCQLTAQTGSAASSHTVQQ